MCSMKGSGCLETSVSVNPRFNVIPSNMRNKRLVKVAERYVKLPSDQETCKITGSIFLPTGEVLLCDEANQAIKLLNKDITVRSAVTLTSRPFDVALVTRQDAIVSLFNEKKLQYVCVRDLTLGRKVSVGRHCFGLAVHKNRIYVTCHDNPGDGEVLILSEDGEVQRRVGSKPDGSCVFIRPNYIAVDAAGTIYVSDFDEHSVTRLNKDCETVFTYRHTNEEHQKRLLVDGEGHVYVCGRNTRTATLQVLTPAGQAYRTLINWPLERWNPNTFCYRSSDRTLLVGLFENNNVHVYRFI